MEEVAISVQKVNKAFKLPHEKHTSIKSLFVNTFRGRRTYEKQQVLKGVSFEIKKGEFVGIVGRNGSGKSTLLKLLAGIYSPDSGHVQVNGKLVPFIELGVGFNPELTGRENVYLNGALLGFGTKEMNEMYDEIVAFAELEKFMDQKLKNYSSGMQVRLAFSIAIKTQSDIMVFDEVLAVGDAAFQRKCLDVFEKYKAEKQTVVLVTHDMNTVRQYCSRAIILKESRILADGNPHIIADEYTQLNQDQIDKETDSLNRRVSKTIQASTLDVDQKIQKTSFDTGDDIMLNIKWKPNKKITNILVDVFKMSGEHITSFNSYRDGLKLSSDTREVNVRLKARLFPGKYFFSIALRDDRDNELQKVHGVGQFILVKNWEKAGTSWSGLVPLDHEWLGKP